MGCFITTATLSDGTRVGCSSDHGSLTIDHSERSTSTRFNRYLFEGRLSNGSLVRRVYDVKFIECKSTIIPIVLPNDYSIPKNYFESLNPVSELFRVLEPCFITTASLPDGTRVGCFSDHGSLTIDHSERSTSTRFNRYLFEGRLSNGSLVRRVYEVKFIECKSAIIPIVLPND